MSQHTYIAYLSFMVSDGARGWKAVSPAAALQKAITHIFVTTGRQRYPNEFGVNLAKADFPMRVIASAELSGSPRTYTENTKSGIIELSDWQSIVAYLKGAHDEAKHILITKREDA